MTNEELDIFKSLIPKILEVDDKTWVDFENALNMHVENEVILNDKEKESV